MVGLFEQWETEQQQNKIQKNAFQKSYKLICILMSEISIWSPINQQDLTAYLFYLIKKKKKKNSLLWIKKVLC